MRKRTQRTSPLMAAQCRGVLEVLPIIMNSILP
jgi:hypothetical protein